MEINADKVKFGQVAIAISDAGGDIVAIDIIGTSDNLTVRDLTVNVDGTADIDRITAAINTLSDVSLVHVSDRTFLLHLGGKIATVPKTPIQNRDDLSRVYTPDVARVCMAIYEDPKKAFTLTIKRNTVAVISDGSAVLGLGNIGPRAAGIACSKILLAAGVKDVVGVVAVVSTAVATIIGTLAAVGMYKYKFKGKDVLDGLLYIPIVIPEIVMGITLLAFFSQAKIPLGLLTLILAHITFSIPFVYVVVRSRLVGSDKSLEEAAMDLGANQWQTFVKITLPIIMPGVVAGALLAFTLSLDDVIISFFTAGPGSTTLPLKVFSMVKLGVSPEINALSTISLLITLTLVIVAERIRLKNTSKKR